MITVECRPKLAVSRGKLISSDIGGVEVHAAAYLHEGRIVLDSALLAKPSELRRFFAHELFHFVWWKLGNTRRLAWERMLKSERVRGARGEMGWSAELRKKKLLPRDIQDRTRSWREYCCESFCDTGAFLIVRSRKHGEMTLAKRFRTARLRWLGDIIQTEEDLVYFVDPQMRWNGFDMPAGMSRMFPGARGACANVDRA